jgi:diaminopimelate epimerase
MKVNFCRYSATGNTFLIFDNRDASLSSISKHQIQSWCESYHVDGLLFLEESSEPKADFHMRYVNADGGEVEMCGNGARSILHFAGQELKITPKKGDSFSFTTMNSLYQGRGEGQFPLLMTEIKDWGLIDVSDLYETEFSYYLNTGVPHTLFQVENLNSIDLIEDGRRIRYDERFSKGTNANFFQIEANNKVRVRTYERGVEGETQSCGTGATAVALSLGKLKGWGPRVEVEVPGGHLVISFNEDFSEVYLEGPVDLKERGFIEM